MRRVNRHRIPRLLVAVLLSAVVALGLWQVGLWALLVACFLLLGVTIFTALTIAPDAIAAYRHHDWRWGRRSEDEGPFWAGTRIPRRPPAPRPPPRHEALPLPTE